MTWFAAYRPVDMRDLSELGYLSDWNNIKAPNTVVGVYQFMATLRADKDIEYKFWGENLTLKNGLPRGGKLSRITVLDHGDEIYSVDLSIKFQKNKIQNEFSNDFEKSLFSGNDTIHGSEGNDILIGYRGNENKIKAEGGDDIVRGKEGHDELQGHDGDDRISGNNGKDTIEGDAGNDVLTGNGGKNEFVFGSALDAATNVDTVTDFKIGKDILTLQSDVFIGIGPEGPLAADKFVPFSSASHPEDVIVYNQATGDLYYDPDGSGGAELIRFAAVTPGLALSAGDFLVS